jgi:hypothetical protein
MTAPRRDVVLGAPARVREFRSGVLEFMPHGPREIVVAQQEDATSADGDT